MRLILALAAAALPGCVAPEADVGRAVYQATCTDCHGASARGDGPLAGLLGSVPDLTRLSARAGGVFPRTRVVRTVTSPQRVHGRISAMPDFGALLAGRPVRYGLPDGTVLDTTDTVLGLVAYLETLQR